MSRRLPQGPAMSAKFPPLTSNRENTMTKLLRQGDVLIIPVDAMPNVSPVKRDARGIILAEGEVTGHFHGISSRSAKLYRTEEDVRYLRVTGTAPVALTHQEHTAVPIPPGNYRVIIHAEYVPGALPRRVED